MAEQTITITLPDALYERIRETAEASSRSLEDVVTQSIALSLPPLESDLPDDIKVEFAALSLLSDDELKQRAQQTLDESEQSQLETMADLQKQRTLSEDEQAMLDRLMQEAQKVMLYRAEILRLLAHRGHKVFASTAYHGDEP